MTVTMIVFPLGSSYVTYTSALGLGAGLLSISYTVIFLIGFSMLYRSRDRFGNDYERNMKRSLYLLIGSVTILIASLVASFLTPRLLRPALGFEAYIEAQKTVSLALGGVQVLAAFLLAFLLYFLVVSLVQSAHQSRLKIAVTLYVTAAAIGYAWAAISNLVVESSFQFDLYGYYAQVSVKFPAILLFWSVYRASHRSLE